MWPYSPQNPFGQRGRLPPPLLQDPNNPQAKPPGGPAYLGPPIRVNPVTGQPLYTGSDQIDSAGMGNPVGNGFYPPPPLQPIDTGGIPTNGSFLGNNLGHDAPFGPIPTDTPQTPTVIGGPFGGGGSNPFTPSGNNGGAFPGGNPGPTTLNDGSGIDWSSLQMPANVAAIRNKWGSGGPLGPPSLNPTNDGLGGLPTDQTKIPAYARGTNRVPAFQRFPTQPLVAGLQRPIRLGSLHPYAMGAVNVPGRFIGRDSVPAMLEPGEAVLNRAAMHRPGMRAKVAYLNKIGGHAAGTSMIKPSHRGLLHQDLGVPQGQKIPYQQLIAAKHSPSAALRKRANFALNFGH